MPPALQKPCNRIGCPNLTTGRYCDEHQSLRHGVRGTTTQRGYGADWQRTRAAILTREPLCRQCAANGITRLAEVVDHIVPIEQAPGRRLDPDNLQPLCKPCHAIKTGAAKGVGGGEIFGRSHR